MTQLCAANSTISAMEIPGFMEKTISKAKL